ncbi:hypothetical protein [Mycobacterium sp.]
MVTATDRTVFVDDSVDAFDECGGRRSPVLGISNLVSRAWLSVWPARRDAAHELDPRGVERFERSLASRFQRV